MLAALSKLYKHPKAATLYVTVPASIAKDSAFSWRAGERVSVTYDPKLDALLVKKREGNGNGE